MPVVLDVNLAFAERLAVGQSIALYDAEGMPIAVMTLSSLWQPDKTLEVEAVYGSCDINHPGVRYIRDQTGEVYLGGELTGVRLPHHYDFCTLRQSPQQLREQFAQRGWERIIAFQTRNPIHRAHEYIQKTALEIVDGLLLHPLVGETKGDDIPADVRVDSYRAILNAYYPASRVLLGVFPSAMRYAGPREAVFHAIARKNYGCSHFIVGRDHAGVGKYYGTYDAQYIFDEFTPEEIGITPLFFEHTFFCRACGTVVSSKTCPHMEREHVVLSGTQVRGMLTRGEDLPVEFTRPEVSAILMAAAKPRQLEQDEPQLAAR